MLSKSFFIEFTCFGYLQATYYASTYLQCAKDSRSKSRQFFELLHLSLGNF